jgi:hypothetical protein
MLFQSLQKKVVKLGVAASVLSLSISALSASSAFATGGSDRGGADAIWGKDGNSDSVATIADFVVGSVREEAGTPVGLIYDEYITSLLSDELSTGINVSTYFTDSEALQTAFNYIAAQGDEEAKEAQEVENAYKKLNFVPVGSIPTIKTGIGFFDLGFNAKRQQLAIQEYPGGKVSYLSQDEVQAQNLGKLGLIETYDNLGTVARGFFHLHEAYIRWSFEQGMDLESAEATARAKVGAIINSPAFGKVLIAKALSEITQFNSYPSFYDSYIALWNIASGGLNKTRQPKDTLKVFSALVSSLGLPCAMNQQGVNEIDQMTLKLKNANWPLGDFKDSWSNTLTRLCDPNSGAK